MALFGCTGGSPSIINCLFRGNTAVGIGYGGGIATLIDTITTITNCTIIGNTSFTGAGTYTSDSEGGHSETIVLNTIIWSNNEDGIGNDAGAITTVSYSDIQGGYKGIGNIATNPMSVDPANGDFRLSSGSPCIDAADNSAVPKGIDTDFDGYDRFVDTLCTDDSGKGKSPIVDMGAYEFQLFQVTCPVDLNCNGNVNTADLFNLFANWGSCE